MLLAVNLDGTQSDWSSVSAPNVRLRHNSGRLPSFDRDHESAPWFRRVLWEVASSGSPPFPETADCRNSIEAVRLVSVEEEETLISELLGDTLAELVGSFFGKVFPKLKVCYLGDVRAFTVTERQTLRLGAPS